MRSYASSSGGGNKTPSRRYIPPHLRSNDNNECNDRFRSLVYEERQNIKAIFFGDSFIKLFSLLNDYTDKVFQEPAQIEVHKYKGGTAKGLCREGNENAKSIQSIIKKDGYSNLERLVFCFGSVDVHLSYYYKKFVEDNELTRQDVQQIAREFVDFVAATCTYTECRGDDNDVALVKNRIQKIKEIIIVGIYPSPLLDDNVGASLIRYCSLENDDQVSKVNQSNDRLMNERQNRVHGFNTALEERCAYYNQNKDRSNRKSFGCDDDSRVVVLKYYDVKDELLEKSVQVLSNCRDNIYENSNKQRSKEMKVKDAYCDVADLNIHLVHETTLQLWISKWDWFKALTANTQKQSRQQQKEPESFVEYLQESFDLYRKTKPWAKRVHVAEKNGVQIK